MSERLEDCPGPACRNAERCGDEELCELAKQAQAVEGSGTEAKLSNEELLHREGS